MPAKGFALRRERQQARRERRGSRTKSLELGRKVSKMVTIEIIEISRIVRSKFRNAPREIKMSGIASGDSFEFEVGGLPPG
jgi:hypothetical protein